MIRHYLTILSKRAWLVGLVAAAAVIAVSMGDRHLDFSGNYRVFFDEGNKRVEAYDQIQAIYGQNDNVLFAVRSKRGAFDPETLRAVRDMTDEAWQLPFASRVDSVANFQNTRAESDTLIVEDLVGRDFSGTYEDINDVRAIAQSDPALAGLLVAPDGDTTAINVTVQLPDESPDEIPLLAAKARELAEKYERLYTNLDIHIVGEVMLTNAFIEATIGDFTSLTPVMFLVVIAVFVAVIRSIVGTLYGVLFSALCIKGAMGLAGWTGMMLTPPTAVAPIIIMTIAVATYIHIYTTFLQRKVEIGERSDAVIDSLKLNFKPVTLTCITTVVGFLSMNFSTVPPFRDLGNVISAGVICAWFLSFTLLPALLIMTPLNRNTKRKPFAGLMNNLSGSIVKNPRLFAIASIAVGVPLAGLASQNELGEKFIEQFSRDVEFRNSADFVNENLTGVYNIEYSIDTGQMSGVYSPEFLKKLDAFTQWLRKHEKVVHVRSLADTLKRLNQNLHGDDAQYYRLPDSRESAAQNVLLYEMSLPYGLDVNDQISLDKAATRVIVTFGDLSTKEVIALENEIETWLESHMSGYTVTHGSPTLMFSHIADENARGVIKGTLLAFLVIAVLLAISFRSVAFGILSMVVNTLPIVTAFGVWALLSGTIGMGVSVVAGMTIGIVVDDTVHFISKYLHARRDLNLTAEESVRYSFSTVGVALLSTTLILVCGFVVMCFSDFARNGDMAKLTAATLVLALAYDFFFLPSTILIMEKLFHGTADQMDEPTDTVPHTLRV